MGCIVYELAALKVPFEAADLKGLVNRITPDSIFATERRECVLWDSFSARYLQDDKDGTLERTAEGIVEGTADRGAGGQGGREGKQEGLEDGGEESGEEWEKVGAAPPLKGRKRMDAGKLQRQTETS